jgi:hypothetical protein
VNRREFLRRAAVVAAGSVAVDQLELLDRLGWKRTLFASAPLQPRTFQVGWQHTFEIVDAPKSVIVEQPYGIVTHTDMHGPVWRGRVPMIQSGARRWTETPQPHERIVAELTESYIEMLRPREPSPLLSLLASER